MDEVAVDAPPLSSSDLSEDDGLPTSGNIQPTQFEKSSTRPPFSLGTKERKRPQISLPAHRFKRTRASGRQASGQEPRSSPKNADSTPDVANAGETSSPPPSKKLRKKSPSSPARKFKAVPDSDPDSPPKRKPFRRNKPNISKDETEEEETQRPVFRIPDEIPEPDLINISDDDLILSPTIETSTGSNLPPSSSSSSLFTDLESIDLIPRCMLCNKEVAQDDLYLFKSRHPRTTVSAMQKFCHQHQRRSARETWLARGYPDIDWTRLDARIAAHYPLLKSILAHQRPSHYLSLFEASIRGGRNRTLLRSDANLTPGYYGIRGLRAMTENLMGELATLLYETSLGDKLVSARGHTTYLQSVLVPELAVRLVMEDMGLGEEEAREVLRESSAVGELLNDEIPDVVVVDRSEEEESGEE
ncbi:hypothetical protein N0V88_006410 [Collariella sp. IMI 366227]|nr:hypothetical protein N0V88_006410 [Collariella sp. IMI 366227]